MNHGTDRSRRREKFDFDKPLPLGELGQKCINGELSFSEAVLQFEKDIIFRTLAHYADNRKAAAPALGLQRSTLQMALARFAKMPVHSPKPSCSTPPALDDAAVLCQILAPLSPESNSSEFSLLCQDILRSFYDCHRSAPTSQE
jgi:hypothetical protein